MTGSLRIRPVDFGDPSEASAFIALLDHYARDPMGGGEPLGEEARAHLVSRLAAHPQFVGAIAWRGSASGDNTDDGGAANSRPVGLINCFLGFSTFAARPLLNVHDIVVRSDRRRQGIGRALLRWAEEQAIARGCCKLTLEVLSGNRAAAAAYADAGYCPYQLDPAAGHALLLQKWL